MNATEQHLQELLPGTEIDWSRWQGASILVTGATGLIGHRLVNVLLDANDIYGLDLRILLPVRDVERASKILDRPGGELVFSRWLLGEPIPFAEYADVLIHAAASTSSRAFIETPVEVARQTAAGADAVLAYARRCGTRSVVMLSTMEVYGAVSGVIDETEPGRLKTMLPRSSYPEGKRFMETLCAAYCSQYGMNIVVARLGQCFGAGVKKSDGRVFAEFARAAVSGSDILLLTDGSSRATYVSVNDAVSAILVLADRGSAGHAYNVANEETYCSVLEMAELVSKHFGHGACNITFDNSNECLERFRQHANLCLSAKKLRQLGWTPRENLVEMYEAMIRGWKKADN